MPKIQPLKATWIRNGKTVQAHKVLVLGEEGPNRAELVSETDKIEQVKFHILQVAQIQFCIAISMLYLARLFALGLDKSAELVHL